MYIFIFLCLWGVAFSEWPPSNCDPNVIREGKHVIFTNQKITKSSCQTNEVYKNVVFINMNRFYNRDKHLKGHSHFNIDIKYNDLITNIDMYNDRIESNGQSCYFPLVTNLMETSFWLRLRSHSLIDIGKTFVSLDVLPFEGENFVSCLKFELDKDFGSFKLGFTGQSETGMKQMIYDITSSKPNLSKSSKTVNEVRLDRLEERVRKLQNTVTKYIQSHDEHVSNTNELKTELKSSINEAHNRIVTRSNAHGMFYMFCFCLLIIGIFACIRWKLKEESRFKLI